MKTFTFTIFGHTFTINLGRKKKEEEPQEEIKMEALPEIHLEYEPSFYERCVDYIKSQEGKLAPSTLKGYRNIIDNHLDSIMTICGINEITEDLIQQAFDEEIAKGLSEKTLKGYRSFVIKVLAEYRPDLKPEIIVSRELIAE